MAAAERHLYAAYCFVVGAFIDFASAVSTHVKAWFDGDGDEFGEPLKQVCAECFAVFG